MMLLYGTRVVAADGTGTVRMATATGQPRMSINLDIWGTGMHAADSTIHYFFA